jgi:6-phospho-beta-glucosidase
VHGRYNATAWAYLEAKGLTPTLEPGDLDALAAAHPDFLAFNYYATHTVEAPPADDDPAAQGGRGGDQQIAFGDPGFYQPVDNPHLPKNAFGWEIDPVGFRMTFRAIYDRYHLPLLVTENGLGAFDVLEPDGTVHDQYRIDYLRAHIEQIQAAIGDGVDVLGYCPWSAIDLVSTHQGIAKRYGFVYVNRDDDDLKDLARYRKDSFAWYQALIAGNTLPD